MTELESEGALAMIFPTKGMGGSLLNKWLLAFMLCMLRVQDRTIVLQYLSERMKSTEICAVLHLLVGGVGW